jgi:phosphonate transport system substrate-binding protein
MTLRHAALAALAAVGLLAGCSRPGPTASAKNQVINFSILSAEDAQSMGRVWQPLLDDLQKKTGLTVKPFYATNYTALVEAMRFNQVQAGWFSALPGLEAVNRAHAQVLGRVMIAPGVDTYNSVLIAKKGSGVTLDKVLACGKRYDYGMGDPRSTSGTLAPNYYLFDPRGIEPARCFKTVRNASHQANFVAVATGVLPVASNNTIGLIFYRRENPDLAKKIQIIWTSPPLPESAILVRDDLDPAVRKKLSDFFFSYGQGAGPQAEHERQVMKNLSYYGFAKAGDDYLDPVRLMVAADDLHTARQSGDAARIAAAQKAMDAVQARVAADHAPPAPAPAPAKAG